MILTEEAFSVHPVDRIPLSQYFLFLICETQIQIEYMKSDLDPYAQGCSNEKIVIERQAQNPYE